MKHLKINPIVLIIINIIAPSMYIFISGRYLMFFLLGFSTVLMLLMGRYKGTLIMLSVFFTMLGIHYITLYAEVFESLGLFFIVLVQCVPCIALAVTLVKNYNSAQLLSALESMRIPRVLVVAVTITVKYIPTFKREFGYIKESMRLRGIEFTWKKPFRSFKYFIVPQLFRCSALAEEVTAAGLVKGINVPKKRTSFFEERFHWYDGLILCLFVTGLVGGFVWKQF